MVELLKINPADNGGAELPRNVEAEAALLGAIMIDNRIAEDVQLKLKAEHFFEPLHGRIYDAIMRLLDKDMVANPVTLKPMLEQDPALKELGGAAYLAQLTGNGAALIGGLILALVVGVLIALALRFALADFGSRMRVTILFSIAAVLWLHIGQPVFNHAPWGYFLYLAFSDFLALAAAGLIAAKLMERKVGPDATTMH